MASAKKTKKRPARVAFTSTRTQPEPEINVTPLVDVVLVLLIIFMVIAPSLQEGLPVLLPEATAVDTKKPDHKIEVVMTADGKLHFEENELEEEALLEAVRAAHERQADAAVVLKADASLPYARVREVFASLSKSGMKGVSLKVSTRRQGDT